MLHTNNQIIKHKVGLLNLAEELQNVSKACKVMGVSRDTFYRYQELASTGNVDALINHSRRRRIGLMSKLNKPSLIMPLLIRRMVSIEPAMNCVALVCLYQAVAYALSGSAIIWKALRNG